MSPITLSEINIYPLKSASGIQVASSFMYEEGLAFDRRLMLANVSGDFISARAFPELKQIKVILSEGGFKLSYSGIPDLFIHYEQCQDSQKFSRVWFDRFFSWRMLQEHDEWFSHILGKKVHLVYTGNQSNRYRGNIGQRVSFADGYPVMLLSEASLRHLNRFAPEHNLMEQFRPNLVVSGSEPYEEDCWEKIQIGDVVFEQVDICTRCIMTTIDPVTGAFRATREPLATLARYRQRQDGLVCFGQYYRALNSGNLNMGDRVRIKSTTSAPLFLPAKLPLSLECVEKKELTPDICSFRFARSNGGRLPLFKPGQYITIRVKIGEKIEQRCYSLTSSPCSTESYTIAVKKISGGAVSSWLHENMQPGRKLLAESPAGEFNLAQAGKGLVMVSAGSGITPLLSMVRWLWDKKTLANTIFIHQARTKEDIPCFNELSQFAKMCPDFHLHFILSQPDHLWSGLTGHLNTSLLNTLIPNLPERELFVCGSNSFVNTVEIAFTDVGGGSEYFHREQFFLEGNDKLPSYKSLELNINGHSFIGNNQLPILQQAEQEGLNLPSGCRAGFCGLCELKLLNGEVEQISDIAGSRVGQEGQCIRTCNMRPVSDVKLTRRIEV